MAVGKDLIDISGFAVMLKAGARMQSYSNKEIPFVCKINAGFQIGYLFVNRPGRASQINVEERTIDVTGDRNLQQPGRIIKRLPVRYQI